MELKRTPSRAIDDDEAAAHRQQKWAQRSTFAMRSPGSNVSSFFDSGALPSIGASDAAVQDAPLPPPPHHTSHLAPSRSTGFVHKVRKAPSSNRHRALTLGAMTAGMPGGAALVKQSSSRSIFPSKRQASASPRMSTRAAEQASVTGNGGSATSASAAAQARHRRVSAPAQEHLQRMQQRSGLSRPSALSAAKRSALRESSGRKSFHRRTSLWVLENEDTDEAEVDAMLDDPTLDPALSASHNSQTSHVSVSSSDLNYRARHAADVVLEDFGGGRPVSPRPTSGRTRRAHRPRSSRRRTSQLRQHESAAGVRGDGDAAGSAIAALQEGRAVGEAARADWSVDSIDGEEDAEGSGGDGDADSIVFSRPGSERLTAGRAMARPTSGRSIASNSEADADEEFIAPLTSARLSQQQQLLQIQHQHQHPQQQQQQQQQQQSGSRLSRSPLSATAAARRRSSIHGRRRRSSTASSRRASVLSVGSDGGVGLAAGMDTRPGLDDELSLASSASLRRGVAETHYSIKSVWAVRVLFIVGSEAWDS